MKCTHCGSGESVKCGFNSTGTQRMRCNQCQRRFTPEPGLNGYSHELRMQSLEMYLDGQGIRRIARNLKVNHQTVANWIREKAREAEARAVPMPESVPEEDRVVELDELFTYVKEKKTKSSSRRKSTGKHGVS